MVNLWVRTLMTPGTTKTFNDVPAKYKEAVRAELLRRGCEILDDGTVIVH
ncbi:MAG: hypothetical protein IKE28_11810 [Solobacterium sp.]|nr:hypothetical protein [Solobacterium sp.]